MPKKKHNPLYQVKQLLETDRIGVANKLIGGGWILVSAYKKSRGKLYYVLGRIFE